MNQYFSALIDKVLLDLVEYECINVVDDQDIFSTPSGSICSHYYLNYATMKIFSSRLNRNCCSVAGLPHSLDNFSEILRILCDCAEYKEFPVRHNEEFQNRELEALLPIPVMENKWDSKDKNAINFDSPHVKAFLLLQAHLSREIRLPSADYYTDTKTVLDQAVRILQAMIDFSVLKGYMDLTIVIISVVQSIKQALWPNESSFLTLPYIKKEDIEKLQYHNSNVQLNYIQHLSASDVDTVFAPLMITKSQLVEIKGVIAMLPFVEMKVTIPGAKMKEGRWLLLAESSYKLDITIVKKYPSFVQKRAISPAIYSPRFPKPQREGWFLLLGVNSKDELLAMKRLQPQSNDPLKYISTQLTLLTPASVGEFDLNLKLLSDGYVGLDSTHFIRISLYI
jgi:activating signal cointegrator complex subunit 3